jgi:hypothetical protein
MLFAASFLATWLVVDPRGVFDAHPSGDLTGKSRDQGFPVEVEVEATPPEDARGDAPSAGHDADAVDMPAPPEIDSLITASALGVDAVERASAITSLRRSLGDAGRDERIRNAFRQAADDPDPLVAVLAQSALEDSQP